MSRLSVLLCGLLVLGACSTPEPSTPTAPSERSDEQLIPLPEGAVLETAEASQEVLVDNLEGSLRPNGEPAEKNVPDILARGRLIVGVDQSQYLLGARNPATGELEGFEVDLAKEIARDIFGDPERVDFRYVDSEDWLLALRRGQVDMVIRSVSITKQRQEQVAFSTPYYRASTYLLAPRSRHIESVKDLGDSTVCAASESTGLNRVRAEAARTLVVRSAADCLLAIQQGQADVAVSDDTILSGLIAQDPFTQMVGESLAQENYGIAFAKPGTRHQTEGLIRQVNATLERIFRDGTWQRSFQEWFGSYLGAQQPPALHYRDEEEPK